MDAERARIQADLRGLLDGEVYCDELRSQLYASDASIYEVLPLGVVRPRHSQDVAQCVRYAAENSLQLFPRGGGTGLAGQSLGYGLILDFSKYMRRLIEIDQDQLRIRVQPGLVLAEMNRLLFKRSLLFGPDPATRSVTTIGSSLAIDSSGSHWPKYGSAGESIESLEVVLASGEIVRLHRHTLPESGHESLNTVDRLAFEVGQIVNENAESIQHPPWRGVTLGCGYRLESVLTEKGEIDLARLQGGAEGTLAIITEATLRVCELPAARGVVLLFFDRLESAARSALEARRDQIAACDLMDRRLLEIARETDPVYVSLLPRGAEAMLLIEQQGESAAEVRQRLMSLVNRIQRKAPTTIASRIAVEPTERDLYWRICRRVIPRLYRLKGRSRPLPFVDDIAIAPERVPEFLVEIQNIFKKERVTATLFAHAAHGQIQVRPFMDLSDEKEIPTMQRLAERLFEKTLEYQGVIAGEHAMGLSRSWFARQQLGSRYAPCRKIKELFDPQGILNPGKLITDAPQRVIDNIRPVSRILGHQMQSSIANPISTEPWANVDAQANAAANHGTVVSVTTSRQLSELDVEIKPAEIESNRNPLLPILQWSAQDDIGQVTRSCNGCGRCRTTAASDRMCPLFRISYSEEASPRAKANALRGLLTGQLSSITAESDEVKALADLCFHCHQCRLECPAQVDIPKLVVEIKAQYVATNGLRWSDLLLTRLDLLAALGSRFPRFANWGLANRQFRWVLEKMTGIAQGRRLPRIANQSFLRWASRRRLSRPRTSPSPKVLFFVDQYINWHNPILGRAFVHILQRHNIQVYVPQNQGSSWMAKIAMGDVRRAGNLIKPTIRMLAEAVRQGYEIVTLEPSAALCLQREYLNIIDDEDSRLVSKHSWEAGRYLWNLHQRQALHLDFNPINLNVLYHQPCHMRAIDSDQPGLQLLKLIPGISVDQADAGCSGMAGTYGLKRENYRTSLRIGWGLISKMQHTSAHVGCTECSACKLQMEQGVDKPTIHPIALMAYAYGQMPEIGKWFIRQNDGLTVL